jgi:hypothetical protein
VDVLLGCGPYLKHLAPVVAGAALASGGELIRCLAASSVKPRSAIPWPRVSGREFPSGQIGFVDNGNGR